MNLMDLTKIREPRVDKKLVLMELTRTSHKESPVIGFENIVAETWKKHRYNSRKNRVISRINKNKSY